MHIGKIYRITNLLNNKVYIGKTQRSIKERWSEHCKSSKCNKMFNAIKKYGKENFKIEEIYYSFDIDDLNQKEMFFISQYDSIEKGYNLTFGGEGALHSKETRNKLSKILKGIDRSYAKKPLLRIQKDTGDIKVYDSLISAINDGFDGRSIRAVCKNERGNYSHKGYHWVYKQDYDNYTSKIYDANNKPIIKYDILTKQTTYYSSSDCCVRDGYSIKSVKNCCVGKRLCYSKCIWFYGKTLDINQLNLKISQLSNPFKVLNINEKCKGYYKHKQYFCSKIKNNSKVIVLGYFKTEQEAKEAYIKALDIKRKEYLGINNETIEL